jgi:alkyldihydroxyacetonephosphate synthase
VSLKRWNGWGNSEKTYPLAESAAKYLSNIVGDGQIIADAGLEDVNRKVPPSRLPHHVLINESAEERVTHSRGQSLPDWVALRHGRIPVFTDGVAYPEDREQVTDLLQMARRHHFVVIPYGGGSSVIGHINPIGGQPVLTLDMGRMNRLMDVDQVSRTARFEAGASGPQIEAELNKQGYTLGHFPQSFEYSTLGGWVATRSVGQQSYRYGRIDEMLLGCEMQTPHGPFDLPAIPASAAGPDLRQVVLGSEGRLGVITSATLKVHQLPEEEHFYSVFFPDWQSGADAAREIVQNQVDVSMLRLADSDETNTTLQLSGKEKLVDLANRGLNLIGIGADRCLLIYGVTGRPESCHLAYRQVQSISHKHKGFPVNFFIGHTWQKSRFLTPYLRNTLWEAGYALDTLETCLSWSKVLDCIREIKATIAGSMQQEEEKILVFAHLSHLYEEGASCYITYLWRRSPDPDETLQSWTNMKTGASRVIVKYSGTISHQHGVGIDHIPYLPAEKGKLGMELIQNMCNNFDPDGIMNPGKLLIPPKK